MIINNTTDVIEALKRDKITPIQAKAVIIKALDLIDITFNDEPEPTKFEVINKLQDIRDMISQNTKPIYFKNPFDNH